MASRKRRVTVGAAAILGAALVFVLFEVHKARQNQRALDYVSTKIAVWCNAWNQQPAPEPTFIDINFEKADYVAIVPPYGAFTKPGFDIDKPDATLTKVIRDYSTKLSEKQDRIIVLRNNRIIAEGPFKSTSIPFDVGAFVWKVNGGRICLRGHLVNGVIKPGS